MAALEIYTTRFCPYCIMAKDLLNQKQIQYREIAVDSDPAVRDAMRDRAGGRHTVPQIFIGDRHIGGCDDLYALERSGELEPLLKESA